ncbi:hypothetical protein tinsulaeT_15330 [Thalassotalea insulae]|uniref:BioF2-like acetyltransferase domain-containing protein n=1 Tax=Thalassotalea insulae TaxID=2056778 RepID=A0ABQ6GQE4_9GAMM|nr:GNAT family N-acetyltransferase [Thalassotalea insulae]GLX78193.1 hypothetical protein tinsulaeT_15330 [Thalassotalea insulae]
MSVICKKIENTEQLISLEKQWENLNNRANHGCIFTSPLWLLTWYKTYWQNNWQLNCYAFFHQDNLVALFPFYYQRNNNWIEQNNLFLLGQGEPEAMEVASEYVDLLILKPFKDDVFNLFFEQKWQTNLNSFFSRAIKPEANITSLIQADTTIFSQQNAGTRYYIATNNWNIKTLSKNNVNRYKRSRNQLAKLNAEFYWVSPKQHTSYWHKMKQFHQTRWQKKKLPGAFSSKQFESFHLTLLAQRDKTAISALSVNGEVIAIHYYLQDENTCYFYQSGWNEEKYNKLSPGFALHLWSIEHCNKQYYDFMMGPVNDSYKGKFKCQESPMYNLAINFSPVRNKVAKILQKIATN